MRICATQSVIHSVEIVGDRDGVQRDMVAIVTAPVVRNCTRISQQLLHRRGADGVSEFYPLGSALNGQGFISTVVAGGTFRLVLPLPGTIAPGEYSFLSRSLYNCRWAWGWIARSLAAETPPITIRIP